MTSQTPFILVQCKICDYVWKYKGRLQFALCPSCRKLNKVSEVKVE